MPNNQIENIDFIKVGHCKQLDYFVTGQPSLQCREFPTIVTLIKHRAMGYILYDTGYADHFFSATGPFPERLYRYLIPVTHQSNSLIDSLSAKNIEPADIGHILISHFHADHIAGLQQFPNAKFICSQEGYEDFIRQSRVRGLLKGYLPALLPNNFFERVKFIESDYSETQINLGPFSNGYALTTNQELVCIHLPGHCPGQYGLYIRTTQKNYFCIADACWTKDAYEQGHKPSRLINHCQNDIDAYQHTINKITELHQQHPKLDIIPSHCQDTYERISR